MSRQPALVVLVASLLLLVVAGRSGLPLVGSPDDAAATRATAPHHARLASN